MVKDGVVIVPDEGVVFDTVSNKHANQTDRVYVGVCGVVGDSGTGGDGVLGCDGVARPIQSHLVSHLKAVQEKLMEQIKDVEATQEKDVPLFLIRMVEVVDNYAF
ncbi:hypothetical protein Droror1_Dr00017605 [Drosera rotundifolia]